MAFDKKSFVVIGGGRQGGIGLNFVKQLLANSVQKIFVFDVCDFKVTASELQTEFPENNVLFAKVDVRNRAEIEESFKKAIGTLGYVDVMANFAGKVDEANAEDIVNINLLGTIFATQIAIEHMSIAKGGHGGTILNTASIFGLDPFAVSPFYTATKFGVVGYTRALAEKELADELGIKFIIICPGATNTLLMAEAQSLMRPKDLAFIDDFIKDSGSQSPAECAKAIIQAIDDSENGSTWIINRGQHSPVKFPLYFKK